MKVCELMEMLNKCDSEAEVVVACECDNPAREGNDIEEVIKVNEIGKGKTTVAIINA